MKDSKASEIVQSSVPESESANSRRRSNQVKVSLNSEELEFLERALSFLPTQADVIKMMQAVKDQKLPKLKRLPGATRELEVKIFIAGRFKCSIWLMNIR